MLSKMDGTVSIGKPMKNVTLVAALAASVAFSANAMTAEIDTDGDGMASLSELFEVVLLIRTVLRLV